MGAMSNLSAVEPKCRERFISATDTWPVGLPKQPHGAEVPTVDVFLHSLFRKPLERYDGFQEYCVGFRDF